MKKTIIIFFLLTSICCAEEYCFDTAGDLYGIPPELLEAISYTESKNVADAFNENNNGTIDYGHMQINSFWIKELGWSYAALDVPCFCTLIGARILAKCIIKNGYNYDALSCYRSGKPLHNLSPETRDDVEKYIERVEKRFKELPENKILAIKSD